MLAKSSLMLSSSIKLSNVASVSASDCEAFDKSEIYSFLLETILSDHAFRSDTIRPYSPGNTLTYLASMIFQSSDLIAICSRLYGGGFWRSIFSVCLGAIGGAGAGGDGG